MEFGLDQLWTGLRLVRAGSRYLDMSS